MRPAVGLLALSAVVSLGLGRYPVSVDRVAGLLAARLLPLEPLWTATDARIKENKAS